MSTRFLIVGLLMVFAGAAGAQEISYEYIEGLYADTDYEEGGVWGESLDEAESQGGFVNLGLAPNEKIYTRVGIGYLAVEDTGIDILSATGTVGTHFPVDDCVDLYMGVQGFWGRASDLNFPRPNVADSRDDIDGYGLGAEIGIRARMGEQFEVEANGNYLNAFGGEIDDVSNDTDDFNASVSLRFYPVAQFSVSGGYAYAFGNEVETWLLGVRYDFCCF